MKIPFRLVAEYRGLDRAAGSADIDGVKVEYGDKLRFEFELPDGTTTDLAVTQAALDRSADFDTAKLAKGDTVVMEGICGQGERGMYVKPVTVQKAKQGDLAQIA